ncbi:MAG: hypothetical protein RSB74_04555 [Kiritimatiellia bacterium]
MEFLRKNGFDLQSLDAEAILQEFLSAMRKGLAGDGDLPMLPSGFLLPETLPVNCEIPAFDVGGTNIRSARICFDANGVPSVTHQLRGYMPGSRGPVDHNTFYHVLCDVLRPNIRDGETLGYCFSYPVDLHGVLLFWTKHIEASSIIRTNVVGDLIKELNRRGSSNIKVRILNDTVAALLATYARHAEENLAGYVGFILGTGTNTAYAERAEAITKTPNFPKGSFVPINCESGNFSAFPHSRFDERYEALSGNTRAQWERCISGVHLGPLGTEILHAAAEEGLFSAGLRDVILSSTYTNVELDSFCAGLTPDVIYCSVKEAQLLRDLLCPMYERAARFAAINIAAAAIQSASARNMDHGLIRVNVDGSTFWKTVSVPFVDLVHHQLEALLKPRGYSCELIRIDDAPLIGAAMATHS